MGKWEPMGGGLGGSERVELVARAGRGWRLGTFLRSGHPSLKMCPCLASGDLRMTGPHVLFPQPVPFRKRLQGGLTVRRTVIIKGFVPFTSKRYPI